MIRSLLSSAVIVTSLLASLSPFRAVFSWYLVGAQVTDIETVTLSGIVRLAQELKWGLLESRRRGPIIAAAGISAEHARERRNENK